MTDDAPVVRDVRNSSYRSPAFPGPREARAGTPGPGGCHQAPVFPTHVSWRSSRARIPRSLHCATCVLTLDL